MTFRSPSPLAAAGLAVAVSLLVAGVWCGRSHAPAVESALDGTVAVRVTHHDRLGMPSKPPSVLRDRARVRALVAALGVDAHPAIACPSDYATADVGLVLSGRDVYARRNVYVWLSPSSLLDASFDPNASPHVVVVSSSGCRGGPSPDPTPLRTALSSTQ